MTHRSKKISLTAMALIAVAAIALGAFIHSKVAYDYDPLRAAEYATEHANRRSVSLCAYYVRQAIEAGGCPTFFFPPTAAGYKDFLRGLDFKEVGADERREVGDIVVFGAVKGHPHGHIAIWNGRQWISDFKQRNLIVARQYSRSDASFFRQSPGPHRRRLFPYKSS